MKTTPICSIGLALRAGCATVKMPGNGRVELPGTHPNHLQDVWREGKHLYWMQTQVMFKTDLEGNILVRKPVEGHHAGCEVRDGKLYVAVCEMQTKTKGRTTKDARVQINEYDADTLELLKKHVVDINDRSGSFCFLPDGTCLVGCLRHGELRPDQVRFHHLDRNFRLIKSYVLDNVNVKLGIEIIRRHGDSYYLFLYKEGGLCLKLDSSFREVDRFENCPGTYGIFWDGEDVWCGVSGHVPGSNTRLCTSALVRRPDFDPPTSGEAK